METVSSGIGVTVTSGIGVTVTSGIGVTVTSGIGVTVTSGIGVTVTSGIGVTVTSGIGVTIGSGTGICVLVIFQPLMVLVYPSTGLSPIAYWIALPFGLYFSRLLKLYFQSPAASTS